MADRIYIGANGGQIAEARAAAQQFRDAGYKVVSTWHDEIPRDGGSASTMTDEQKTAKANTNFMQIDRMTDVFVMLTSPGLVTGEKFVELGRASAQFMEIYIVGRRENLMSFADEFVLCPDIATVIDILDADGLSDGGEDNQ